MNISKKAIMSFIVALTSAVAMAQPYYHIMKEENGKLTEQTGYNSKDYKIKIDMVPSWKLPERAIGGRITITRMDGHSPIKRSFYFTKNGNVYYNESEGKFHFEKSQLDYPRTYSKDHCGHFRWGRTIEECIDVNGNYNSLSWPNATEKDFYFANPENLGKLQEDLGNEDWAVLSNTEWSYVINRLGRGGYKINGEYCYLIDTTPDKKLIETIERKYTADSNWNMSKEDFEYYEAQGLVCLPVSGVRNGTSFDFTHCYYWSCTPYYNDSYYINTRALAEKIDYGIFSYGLWEVFRATGLAVRLVILADD